MPAQATQLTWLDKAITALSPKWGYRRMGYRQAISVLGSYRGGETNRLRADWNPVGGSADSDLLTDLPTLRDRSRELDRNNGWARSVYNTIATNAIGTGLAPQSRVNPEDVGATPDQVREWQRATERIWREHLPMLDAQRRLHGWMKQMVLFRSMLQNGDVLDIPLRMRVGGRRVIGLATEIVEADRLTTPMGVDPILKERVREGVEFNAEGKPVGYWVRKTHPGDQGLTSQSTFGNLNDFIRYPALNSLGQPNVFHLFYPTRPGQSRGEPWLAPALAFFKDMGDFMEAKVVAERIGACFGVFFKRADPYTSAQSSGNTQGTQRHQTIEPGMMLYGEPGEEVTSIKPDLGGTDLDAFITAVLKAVGASVNLPYELFTKDFTKTTYLSARASLLEAWRFFRCYQLFFSSTYLQPLWEMVQLEAWSRGLLPNVDLLGPNMSAWLHARWVPPGRGYIDAVKETKASIEAINAGLSTFADELAAQGKDWEEVMEQQQREAEKRKELGLDEEPEETPAPTEDLPGQVEEIIQDINTTTGVN